MAKRREFLKLATRLTGRRRDHPIRAVGPRGPGGAGGRRRGDPQRRRRRGAGGSPPSGRDLRRRARQPSAHRVGIDPRAAGAERLAQPECRLRRPRARRRHLGIRGEPAGDHRGGAPRGRGSGRHRKGQRAVPAQAHHARAGRPGDDVVEERVPEGPARGAARRKGAVPAEAQSGGDGHQRRQLRRLVDAMGQRAQVPRDLRRLADRPAPGSRRTRLHGDGDQQRHRRLPDARVLRRPAGHGLRVHRRRTLGGGGAAGRRGSRDEAEGEIGRGRAATTWCCTRRISG